MITIGLFERSIHHPYLDTRVYLLSSVNYCKLCRMRFFSFTLSINPVMIRYRLSVKNTNSRVPSMLCKKSPCGPLDLISRVRQSLQSPYFYALQPHAGNKTGLRTLTSSRGGDEKTKKNEAAALIACKTHSCPAFVNIGEISHRTIDCLQ